MKSSSWFLACFGYSRCNVKDATSAQEKVADGLCRELGTCVCRLLGTKDWHEKAAGGVLAKEKAPKLTVCCYRVTPQPADQASTRDAPMCRGVHLHSALLLSHEP